MTRYHEPRAHLLYRLTSFMEISGVVAYFIEKIDKQFYKAINESRKNREWERNWFTKAIHNEHVKEYYVRRGENLARKLVDYRWVLFFFSKRTQSQARSLLRDRETYFGWIRGVYKDGP